MGNQLTLIFTLKHFIIIFQIILNIKDIESFYNFHNSLMHRLFNFIPTTVKPVLRDHSAKRPLSDSRPLLYVPNSVL